MNRLEKRSKIRNRNRRIKRFLLTAIVIVLVTGFGISWADTADSKESANAGESGNTTASDTKAPESAAENNKFIFQQPTIKICADDLINTHYLELVNSDHSIIEWPDSEKLVPAWSAVPVGVSQDILLNEEALSAVRELFEEARQANTFTYYVGSGFRDFDEQKRLYDEMRDKSYVQPPNHSEHHTGLAVDIYALGLNTYEMSSSREGKWLAGNAWKHGLILRYAEDKSDITQIAYEPWHFRYVGIPHAFSISQNNLCLEEYIQFLKDSGGYTAEFGGMSYTILYEKPENGLISIPEGKDHIVSGDNTGGYIITVWE
jgi:D-alanyl-D-alanine carboxypeptidase